MSGTLTIGGLAAGLLGGENDIGPQTMQGTAVIGARSDLILAAGDNTISVPATAYAVYIVLPAASTAALTIRTNLNSTDTGTPVGPTGFVVFPLRAGTTQLIINAASSTGACEATFI